MTISLRHVGVVVQNLDIARRFWCDAMGFSVQSELRESGPYVDDLLGLSGAEVTSLKLSVPGGQVVELLHFPTHPESPVWRGTPTTTGYTHIAVTVTDLESTRRRLQAEGAELVAQPQKSPDGKVLVAYCRGPEGVLVELVEELGRVSVDDRDEASR